jgi:hypothetical protein
MKLVFQGVVSAGDSYRCGWGEDDPDGAVLIAGRDVVHEVENVFNKGLVYTAIYRGASAITMQGALKVMQGWGYSEYTPMDSDSLFVGPHDLIELILAHRGEEVTVWFADETFNIFDDLKIVAEDPRLACASVKINNDWELIDDPMMPATYLVRGNTGLDRCPT